MEDNLNFLINGRGPQCLFNWKTISVYYQPQLAIASPELGLFFIPFLFHLFHPIVHFPMFLYCLFVFPFICSFVISFICSILHSFLHSLVFPTTPLLRGTWSTHHLLLLLIQPSNGQRGFVDKTEARLVQGCVQLYSGVVQRAACHKNITSRFCFVR